MILPTFTKGDQSPAQRFATKLGEAWARALTAGRESGDLQLQADTAREYNAWTAALRDGSAIHALAAWADRYEAARSKLVHAGAAHSPTPTPTPTPATSKAGRPVWASVAIVVLGVGVPAVLLGAVIGGRR